MNNPKPALIALLILHLFLSACGSGYPNEGDVAEAWVNNSYDEDKSRFTAATITNLNCSKSGDGIITCDYKMGSINHTNVFDKSLTGKWTIRNEQLPVKNENTYT